MKESPAQKFASQKDVQDKCKRFLLRPKGLKKRVDALKF